MRLRPEQAGRGRGIAAVIEGFFAAMWFVPLGRFFGERLLEVSGWVITVVAVLAGVTATTDANSSTVAGVGTGLILLVTGMLTLLGIRLDPHPTEPGPA